MGEVDYAQDAEDEGEPARYQEEYEAILHAVQKLDGKACDIHFLTRASEGCGAAGRSSSTEPPPRAAHIFAPARPRKGTDRPAKLRRAGSLSPGRPPPPGQWRRACSFRS